MYKPISVCIPVYDEGRTIARTLDSILDQTFSGDMEILVGANGCKDNTEKVVKKYSSQFPNIKLLKIAERGRPNAWKVLRKEASYNNIIFTDGDVVIDRDAFSRLYETLEQSGKTAVGGLALPVFNGCSSLTKLVAGTPSLSLRTCLSGALYAVDNKKLGQRMHARGYHNIPKDIIYDDLWLSLMLGRKNWVIDYGARVYFKPYSWEEMPKMLARDIKANKQICTEYPELVDGYSISETFMERTIRRLNKLKSAPGLPARLDILTGFMLRKIAQLGAYAIIANEYLNGKSSELERSAHSKTPIQL